MTAVPWRWTGAIAGCVAIALGLGLSSPATAAAPDDSWEGPIHSLIGSVPSWARPSADTGTVPADRVRAIQVTLALRDPVGATRLAAAVSAPGKPDYGHHLTARQFTDRFAPTRQTVSDVTTWLNDQGIRVDAVSANRQVIDAHASVGTLDAAFGVQLHTYRHAGRRLTAPDAPVKLPPAAVGMVTGVLGLDDSATTVQSTAPGSSAAPSDQQYCARWWGQANNRSVPQKYAQQSNTLCGYTAAQVRGIYGLRADATGAGQTVAVVGNYDNRSTPADLNRWAAPGCAA